MLSLSGPLTQPLPQCSGHQPYDLHDLVRDIKSHLGQTGGVDSSLNTDYLISLMKKYASNPDDWIQFFHNDTSKNYTRNTIENINSKANILLLVWNPTKGSPVHDHANAHCVMKVLAGELMETVYHTPESTADKSGPLQLKSQTVHPMDAVTYISDDIGLHRVHNPDPNQIAVSLHLYTPPNAADYGYHIFDETTGRACFVPQARAYLKPESSDCKD